MGWGKGGSKRPRGREVSVSESNSRGKTSHLSLGEGRGFVLRDMGIPVIRRCLPVLEPHHYNVGDQHRELVTD